ncbi:glycosyltransferase [Tistrella bauzanensis]|uniref:glycosyltransferase n=1 Tax=Tistrella bauzanensis TaxID=657419 RepID=UPI00166C8645|nr:glycosyltransferase [Tistrella bauzanensis]
MGQAYDPGDPLLAGTIAWVDRFHAHCPDGVVGVFQRVDRTLAALNGFEAMSAGHGRSWTTLRAFYSAVWQAHRRHRFVRAFVYMDGPFVPLLWPLAKLLGFRLYQWRAHPVVPLRDRIAARYLVDRIYTSVPSALPVETRRRVLVATGVDLRRFRPDPMRRPDADFIFVGRISPAKRVREAVGIIRRLRDEHGLGARLLVVGGPATAHDQAYMNQVRADVAAAGLDDAVTLLGARRQDELPALLGRARFYLNVARTAVDRSLVEAMHCGLPPVNANRSVHEMLDGLIPAGMSMPDADDDAVVAMAAAALRQRPDDYAALSDMVADLAARRFTLDALVARIATDIAAYEAR